MKKSLVLVLALTLVFVGGYKLGKRINQPTYSSTEEVYVFQGDTLWEIALSVKGAEKKDIREVVSDIKELNNIGSNIQGNTVIKVPVYEK